MNFRSPYGFYLPVVTKNLLIINCLMYLLTFVFAKSHYANLNDYFSLHHHYSDNFKPYQFVTHMFMHGNLGHLFSNMFGLVIFGKMVEEEWGAKRFLIFYILCGLGGSVPHYIIENVEVMKLINLKNDIIASHYITVEQSNLLTKLGILNSPFSTTYYLESGEEARVMNIVYDKINLSVTLGASGALYGILGAAFFMFGNRLMSMFLLPITIPLKYFVTIYMIVEITGGLRNNPLDNVAHFAHIGGLVVGMIIVLIWERNRMFHS